MEINKPEVAAIVAVLARAEDALQELNELELATVGGGVGEVILA